MALLERTLRAYKSQGAGFLLRSLPATLTLEYYRLFKRASFAFHERHYRYFYHQYNSTWKHERAVEIPIVWERVREVPSERVLEVGNVLSHYFRINHKVVDKYEKANGVMNVDVVNYSPKKRYKLIASISTLEHVGWDEEPQDPQKLGVALQRLRSLLETGGTLIATVPLGYNPRIDSMVDDGTIFDVQYFLKRVSLDNRWRECSREELRGVKYANPFGGANGLVVGLIGGKPL